MRRARKRAQQPRQAPELVYWVRGGNVAKMGPYKSYLEASRAILGHDGTPVPRACIWAEAKQ